MNRSRWIAFVLFIALGLVLAAAAPAAKAGEAEACCPMMKGGMAMGHGMMMHGGPMMMRHGMRMKMMHGHGMGLMGGPGMMASCPCCGGMGSPMMSGDVVKKVEKTADGVVVRISAKDPELVKKIQAHFHMMGKMMEKMTALKAAAEGCAEGCSEDCPMKKKEVKK